MRTSCTCVLGSLGVAWVVLAIRWFPTPASEPFIGHGDDAEPCATLPELMSDDDDAAHIERFARLAGSAAWRIELCTDAAPCKFAPRQRRGRNNDSALAHKLAAVIEASQSTSREAAVHFVGSAERT